MARYRLQGLEAHVRHIEGLSETLDAQLFEELNVLGETWRAHASRTALWDTGTMSRGYKFDGTKKKGKNFYVRVYNEVPYARFVEEGHAQSPGRYVPALGRRLVKDFVPGHHGFRRSTRRARMLLPSVLKKVVKELHG